MTKKREALAKRKVARVVKKLNAQETTAILNEIAESKPTAPAQRVPGLIINGQKTSWTLKDFELIYGVEQFTPEERCTITINGVKRELLANVTCLLPKNFIMVYQNHRREKAKRPRFPDTGFETEITLGAGALEPQ